MIITGIVCLPIRIFRFLKRKRFMRSEKMPMQIIYGVLIFMKTEDQSKCLFRYFFASIFDR